MKLFERMPMAKTREMLSSKQKSATWFNTFDYCIISHVFLQSLLKVLKLQCQIKCHFKLKVFELLTLTVCGEQLHKVY